jgi:hypothetical protein
MPPCLQDALDRIAPEGYNYRHDDEGPDDMPAHVKSSLMGPSLTIPVAQVCGYCSSLTRPLSCKCSAVPEHWVLPRSFVTNTAAQCICSAVAVWCL